MRVYLIGRHYQATEIDVAWAAQGFTGWLTDKATPVLGEVIQRWLWQPPDAGGLGTLAESGRDLRALGTEIAALRQHALEQREPDGRQA